MDQVNYKFLVVDDHLVMRQMVSILLTRFGLTEIDTAKDGVEALSKIEAAAEASNPYDIVFLDWGLPNMNGFQLLTTLRKEPKYKNMAIIMMSSESSDSHIAKAIVAGATSYITKPFKPDDILKNIDYLEPWRKSLEDKGAS